jgi:hypothetical protein
MTEKDGVSSAATDEDKQDTPPAEGADKGSKPDRNGWIPREQFDQLVATVADLATAVKDGVKPKAPEPKKEEPPKTLTRADLRAAVEKQQLTQEEADNIWDRQLIEQAKNAAREEAGRTLTVTQTGQRIDADLRQYRAVVPNAWKEGTEERAKVADEFRALVALGLPDSKETELAAMRSVFGPVEKLDKARSKPSVEADEQSGGAGEESERGTKQDVVKGLSAREKDYYGDQIKKGRYKDWNEVGKELEKYGNPALRRKMGARA